MTLAVKSRGVRVPRRVAARSGVNAHRIITRACQCSFRRVKLRARALTRLRAMLLSRH